MGVQQAVACKMILLTLSAFILLAFPTIRAEDDPATLLFDEYWQWRLERSPEFATMVGMKEFNSVLETFTEKRFLEDFLSSQNFSARAEELKNQTENESLLQNLQLFVAEVETYVKGYKYNGFYFP